MKVKELGEFRLINLLCGQIPPPSDKVIRGIGDDTAVLTNDDKMLVLMTTDMLVEDIHFSFRHSPFKSVGWKALAVNVSDIAAMGGLPTGATVSIGIPPHLEVSQVEELYFGLSQCAREYGTDIVGGDTVKSPRGLVINVTLLGRVEPDRVIYRSGARPGDIIMVTGPLGNSAAGLYILTHDLPQDDPDLTGEVIKAHLYPRARVKEGRVLSETGYVTSMNDISDGLASEVLEICEASAVGCELDAKSVPYSKAVAEISSRAGVTPLQWALNGGEDFELVFTVKPQGADKVMAALEEAGASPSVVGRIMAREHGYSLREDDRKSVLRPAGYDHFKE